MKWSYSNKQNKPHQSCNFGKTISSSNWIQLTQQNTWIYAVSKTNKVDIICNETCYEQEIYGNGIIKIAEGCMIKDKYMEIMGNRKYGAELKTSYLPMMNLSMQLNNTQVQQIVPEKMDFSINDAPFKRIATMIDAQKEDENSWNKLTTHDMHQYALSYSTVIIILVCVIVFFKLNGKKQSVSHDRYFHGPITNAQEKIIKSISNC